MSQGSALKTMEHVVERKLSALRAHQRLLAHEQEAIRREESPRLQLHHCLDVFDRFSIDDTRSDSMTTVSSIRHFLRQADYDTTISDSMIDSWKEALQGSIDQKLTRYNLTFVFSSLVKEWLEAATSKKAEALVADTDSFEFVGRAEMHRQRQEWQEYAFVKQKVSTSKITNYLDKIFAPSQGTELTKGPLQLLRDRIQAFDPPSFDVESVKSSIRSVLQSDLYAGDKRRSLVELLTMDTVLSEMVDVLNSDLDLLDDWTWGVDPIALEMRKQQNGRYRVFMQEEFHQSILLNHIGAHCASRLKSAFTSFAKDGGWNFSCRTPLDQASRARRKHFLGKDEDTTRGRSIRQTRKDKYMANYFMSQLPDSAEDGYQGYHDAQGGQDRKGSTKMHTVKAKQSLLHLLTTEMIISNRVHGSFAVWQSDFKWFGPSLSHDTLITVMRFFGFAERYIRFLTEYLQPNLVFEQDGPGGEANLRRRGVPMGHLLGDALCEALLFVCDYAVNQGTGGMLLWRLHDDLWFWGEQSACETAWTIVQEFAEVMGLEMNMDKTGHAVMTLDGSAAASTSTTLPPGDVTWGFLKLDAMTASWTVNYQVIDVHVEELQLQLQSCDAVLQYVQAYNAYISAFFLNNLGKPALCLGLPHLDAVIETMVYIQRRLTIDKKQDIHHYLTGHIEAKFGASGSIPAGFLFFPAAYGGIGLSNPLIAMLAKRDAAAGLRDPRLDLEEVLQAEVAGYERARERFEAKSNAALPEKDKSSKNGAAFMSLREYSMYAEERSVGLVELYSELLKPTQVLSPGELRSATNRGSSSRGTAVEQEEGIKQWLLLELYGDEVKRQCGRLLMIEKEFAPLGPLTILRDESVRWRG